MLSVGITILDAYGHDTQRIEALKALIDNADYGQLAYIQQEVYAALRLRCLLGEYVSRSH
jgi:hypothetical protein